MKLFIGKDSTELARMGAGALATTLRKSGGYHPFSIVLSGGSTPKAMYALFLQEPYKSMLPWDRLHFFFGDGARGAHHLAPLYFDVGLPQAHAGQFHVDARTALHIGDVRPRLPISGFGFLRVQFVREG